MTPPPSPSPPAPPDARLQDPALSLLDQIMREALDSGYAEAAARRDTAPTQARRRPHATPVVVGVILGALAFAVIALVVETRLDAPGAAEARQALIGRIDRVTETTDQLESEVTALRAEVETIQNDVLEAAGAGDALVEQLAALRLATGTSAVSGPGLEVVLDDASDADVPPDVDPDLTRVLDRDLQLAVNGLWAAGAEAIAINGQRLTSLTAIRSAGDAILVNYRPLTRPYTVAAIGNPDTLGVDFVDGGAGRTLRTLQQTYGIRFETQDEERVELPPAVVGELNYVNDGEG